MQQKLSPTVVALPCLGEEREHRQCRGREGNGRLVLVTGGNRYVTARGLFVATTKLLEAARGVTHVDATRNRLKIPFRVSHARPSASGNAPAETPFCGNQPADMGLIARHC